MKKILTTILIITLMFTLTGCSPNKEQEKTKTDALKFKEEYEKKNGEKM